MIVYKLYNKDYNNDMISYNNVVTMIKTWKLANKHFHNYGNYAQLVTAVTVTTVPCHM